MQKAMLALLLPLLVIGLALPGYAQDGNETTNGADEGEDIECEAGVTPDSPLWGIDKAWDRLSINLARGPDKAEKGLGVALERLCEIQEMNNRDDAEAAEAAEEEHGEVLTEVETSVDEFDGVEVEEERVIGIENGMANHLEAIAKVKARIQANPNIPDEVKARLIAKFTDLEGRAEELKVKIGNKKLQIELKRKFAGIEEEVELKVRGTLTAEQTDLVEQLVTSLDESKTNAEIDIECGSGSGRGREGVTGRFSGSGEDDDEDTDSKDKSGSNRGKGSGAATASNGEDGEQDGENDENETEEDEDLEDEADENETEEDEVEKEGCEVEISGELTAEQQSLVDSLVLSLETSGARVSVEIESKFEAEVEAEEDEAENETEEQEEAEEQEQPETEVEVEVKVEIVGNTALITAEINGNVEVFTFAGKDQEAIIKFVANRLKVPEEQVRANIEFE